MSEHFRPSQIVLDHMKWHLKPLFDKCYDARCQNLLEKLEAGEKARQLVSNLSQFKLISRHTNFYLHRAINRAEEFAYYSHYLYSFICGEDREKLKKYAFKKQAESKKLKNRT